MAKKLKATPDGDDAKSIPNSDNMEAVFLSHLNKLRAQQNKVAAAKTAYDAERSVMNDLFALAKADKFTRKELQAILDDGAASRRDLTAEEERRAKLRTWAGLPAGSQADLFENTPSAAIDELTVEGHGYTAGLRGDDSAMPEQYAPHHAQAWLRGYHAGQEKLAWAFAEAGGKPDHKETGIKPSAVPLEPVNDDDAGAEVADAA